MALKKHRYYRPGRRAQQQKRSHNLYGKTKHSRTEKSYDINIGAIRKTVSIIFLVASVVWFVYFFFASDNFLIKTVEIHGVKNIPETELNAIVQDTLQQRRFGLFKNTNILLVSKKDLNDAISKKYILEGMTIDRIFPYTLSITINEKLARLILRVKTPIVITEEKNPATSDTETAGVPASESTQEEGDATEQDSAPVEPTYTTKYYYLDVNGIIVSAGLKDESDMESIPIIEMIDTNKTTIKPGDQIITRERITNISHIYGLLNRSSIHATVQYITINQKSERELNIVTSEGWEILLDTNIDIESQLKKLELVLDEKIKEDRQVLRYVDLRVKDRVYYKLNNL